MRSPRRTVAKLGRSMQSVSHVSAGSCQSNCMGRIVWSSGALEVLIVSANTRLHFWIRLYQMSSQDRWMSALFMKLLNFLACGNVLVDVGTLGSSIVNSLRFIAPIAANHIAPTAMTCFMTGKHAKRCRWRKCAWKTQNKKHTRLCLRRVSDTVLIVIWR